MRILLCPVAAMLLTAQLSGAATKEPARDPLIDKLVEKGVMTGDEARELQREPASSKLPFEIKLRAQARLDAGDLVATPEGGYRSESDLFLRRVRLELEKKFRSPPFGRELELNLTLEADRLDQDFRNGRRRDASNRVGIQYVYGDWIFNDQLGLEVGKHKLPLLRVELTSSSRQLLIERPAVTGVAKDSLGDYHQPQLMLHGGAAEGAVRYYFSLADGAANLDALQEVDGAATEMQGRRSGKALMARVEVAPLGLATGGGVTEKKKDDTGVGAEDHLTLGINGGYQRNIRYATDTVADARVHIRVISADLAGRYRFGTRGALTGQLEYVDIRRDFNYRDDEGPQGGYFQAGYLLPFALWRGQVEPVLRYELFDHDRVEVDGASGTKERSVSIGVNHYLVKHSIKWAYNFVHTRFDPGVAQAANSRNRDLHQLLLQLYF